MTGQVKEDIISRFGELGLLIKNGIISFNPSLIKKEEFLTEKNSFTYYDIQGNENSSNLEPGSLAFTFCQVPVIIRKATSNSIMLLKNGLTDVSKKLSLSADESKSIFERNGEIELIEVNVVL